MPGAYMHQEASFTQQLNRVGSLKVRHYHRPGWVFHSKGVWHTQDEQTSTIIGSSSFGGRSVLRDFDLSFLLTTRDPDQRAALAAERALIAQFAPTERHVPRIYQRLMPWITPSIQGFL